MFVFHSCVKLAMMMIKSKYNENKAEMYSLVKNVICLKG